MVRVLYEDDMLSNIVDTLNENIDNIPPFTRANFVSDNFAFAENEPLTGVDIEQTLTNTQFMVDENEYVVWVMFNQGMDYIWSILKYTSNGATLDEYVRSLVQTYYERYGWDQDLENIRFVPVPYKWLSQLNRSCGYFILEWEIGQAKSGGQKFLKFARQNRAATNILKSCPHRIGWQQIFDEQNQAATWFDCPISHSTSYCRFILKTS